MKTSLRVLALIASSLVISAQADLYYNFETGAGGFSKGTWSSTGPASVGLGSLKAAATGGGWLWTVEKNFSAAEQQEISTMAGFGANAVLTFDVIVSHASSFPAGSNTWFQINLAGNSPGSPGWAQFADIFKPDGWHDQSSSGQLTKSFSYTFPQLGFTPNEAWCQINFGANSDGAVPVSFYLDNIRLSVVPEPGAMVLGLMAAGLVAFRHRKA